MCTYEKTNCWDRIASVLQATIGSIRQSVALCSDHGHRINHKTPALKVRIWTSSPRPHGQDSSTQRCDRKPSRMFALTTLTIAKFFLFRARSILLRSDWEMQNNTLTLYFDTAHHCIQSHATHRFQVLVLLPFSQCFNLR